MTILVCWDMFGGQALQYPYIAQIAVTVITLNFRTNRSGQTLQTQIRLLLEEQSDQGLHCLLFHLFDFKVDYSKVSWRPKILELYGTYTKIC